MRYLNLRLEYERQVSFSQFSEGGAGGGGEGGGGAVAKNDFISL